MKAKLSRPHHEVERSNASQEVVAGSYFVPQISVMLFCPNIAEGFVGT